MEELLRLNNVPRIGLVICGGSALLATGLVHRTTRDVDVVAAVEGNMELKDPEPFSPDLNKAVQKTALSLGLPEDWLNCGPCDLFRMGLPKGFAERLEKKVIGKCLTVYFISRLDQIHFKLYASVDRGGYHIDDLLTLNPEPDELIAAAKWSMTHDVSEGYALMLKELLIKLGYGNVAGKI